MPVEFSGKPVANQDLVVKNREWKRDNDPSSPSEWISQPVLVITNIPDHLCVGGAGQHQSLHLYDVVTPAPEHTACCTEHHEVRSPFDNMQFLKGVSEWVDVKCNFRNFRGISNSANCWSACKCSGVTRRAFFLYLYSCTPSHEPVPKFLQAARLPGLATT